MLIISIIYTIIAVLAIRPFAGGLAWQIMENSNVSYYSHNYKHPTGEHWFVGYLGGIIGAALWPLVIAAGVIGNIDKFTIGPEREHRNRLLAERQAKELVESKARIRELEREAGIHA